MSDESPEHSFRRRHRGHDEGLGTPLQRFHVHVYVVWKGRYPCSHEFSPERATRPSARHLQTDPSGILFAQCLSAAESRQHVLSRNTRLAHSLSWDTTGSRRWRYCLLVVTQATMHQTSASSRAATIHGAVTPNRPSLGRNERERNEDPREEGHQQPYRKHDECEHGYIHNI